MNKTFKELKTGDYVYVIGEKIKSLYSNNKNINKFKVKSIEVITKESHFDIELRCLVTTNCNKLKITFDNNESITINNDKYKNQISLEPGENTINYISTSLDETKKYKIDILNKEYNHKLLQVEKLRTEINEIYKEINNIKTYNI